MEHGLFLCNFAATSTASESDMIFYFSGNGNSKWVAERLGTATGDTVADMMRLTDDEARAMTTSARRVGLVFPIHSWDAPVPVKRFVRDVLRAPLPYTYVVCTCGDDAGKAMQRLGRLLGIDAAWSVQMPNTYVPMFDLDSDGLMADKLRAAARMTDGIARKVLARAREVSVTEGRMAWAKTYVVSPMFQKFMVSARRFHIDGDCNGCGICAKACPTANIAITPDGPRWGSKCTHCMACLHRCPRHIIEWGKSTRGRGRYDLGRALRLAGLDDKRHDLPSAE